MAFTIGAWFESIDTGTALTTINALGDQHLTTSGDDVLVPSVADKLMGVYVVGVDLTRGRFETPSLRKALLYDVHPVDIGNESSNPYPLTLFPLRPYQLVSGEGARVAVVNDGASASDVYALAFFTDGNFTLPAGEFLSLRMTGTTTLTADAWSLATMTLSQQLEAGRYAIIGMRAEAAGLVAARLVIPGSPFRPGVVGVDTADDVESPDFRMGKLGNWGEFEHTFPPQVEFLSFSADTAETVWLDLVKVRSGTAGGV